MAFCRFVHLKNNIVMLATATEDIMQAIYYHNLVKDTCQYFNCMNIAIVNESLMSSQLVL